ncbi:hypothetical protein MMC21_003586 [Puttea exsequens]|nr:hypothetical protein [Puttea exsequens]
MDVVKAARPALNRLYLSRKKPSSLPLRPLLPDRFRPPRGEKQVFLPNFVLTFLRPHPEQPANFASFLTPLWLNKLDLKDYLYHAYGVQTLHVRSFIIHGKVVRDTLNKRVSRLPQQKKMTIEMPPDQPFVWPEEPEDKSPWDWAITQAGEKAKKEREEGVTEQGNMKGGPGKKERETLRERAKALLKGKATWRPGWEEYPVG